MNMVVGDDVGVRGSCCWSVINPTRERIFPKPVGYPASQLLLIGSLKPLLRASTQFHAEYHVGIMLEPQGQ